MFQIWNMNILVHSNVWFVWIFGSLLFWVHMNFGSFSVYRHIWFTDIFGSLLFSVHRYFGSTIISSFFIFLLHFLFSLFFLCFFFLHHFHFIICMFLFILFFHFPLFLVVLEKIEPMKKFKKLNIFFMIIFWTHWSTL